MKNWIEETFKKEKIAIGIVHFLPLPSDPLFDKNGGINKIFNKALEEVKIYQECGIDALYFINGQSIPYQYNANPAILSTMSYIIGGLSSYIKIPYGANVNSDPISTIRLCCSTNCSFTRGVFSGTYSSNIGFSSYDIGEIIRLKFNLGKDNLKLIHFIQPESGKDIANRDPIESMKSSIFSNFVDGIGIAGSGIGKSADIDYFYNIKSEFNNIPLFALTGLNKSNLNDIYKYVDGAFIASEFHKNKSIFEELDPDSIKQFISKLDTIR